MSDRRFYGLLFGLWAALAAAAVVTVFPGRMVLPQGFSVGPLPLRSYGLCMGLAALIGYIVAKRRAAAAGIGAAHADDMVFWTVVTGFVFARLYHVLCQPAYYAAHVWEIPQVWHGGLSIYGAVFGGVCAVLLLRRNLRLNISAAAVADWLAPSLVIGQMIGRFGNAFNYELYGYPTGVVWKMFVPESFRAPGFEQYSFFHPLFLYEGLCCGLIAVFLLKYESQIRRRYGGGGLFLCYVLWYNTVRFFLEFLRIDSVFLGTVRVNAVVSALLVLVSLAVLFFRKRRLHYEKIS